MRPFFRWFDRAFYRSRNLYLKLVGHSIRRKIRYLLLFLVIVVSMAYLFKQMPTAYLPEEDQGMLFTQIMLPANSSLEQTKAILDKVRNHFLVDENEAVESLMTVAGFSFSGKGQNVGMAFVRLRDWELRDRPGSESESRGRQSHGRLF